MFCALLILVERFKKRKTTDEERTIIYQFYLKNTRRCNNWDLVDLSCPTLVGGYLLHQTDHSLLYRLAESDNLWEQRIAIVSTITLIRHDQFADTLALSKQLMNHKHDLMHKAVGWMLREIGKRDRNVLTDFLDEYATRLPRTALRYALSGGGKTGFSQKEVKPGIRNPSSASTYPQTTKAGYSGTAYIPQIDRKDIARQNISLKYKSRI